MDMKTWLFLITLTVRARTSLEEEQNALSRRIHNGTPTTYQEYPFFATILVLYTIGWASQGSASLLTNSLILTAAHTLDNLTKVWTTERYFWVEIYHANTGHTSFKKIAEYRRHPFRRVKEDRGPMVPDIAVIRLREAISAKLTHISLPSPFEEAQYLDTGKSLTFIGTGRDSPDPIDVRTMPVTLSKYHGPGEAYRVHTLTPPFLWPDHGDSGGPVVASGAARNVVIAVGNSIRWERVRGHNVGVNTTFTRVALVMSWILHSVDSDSAGAAELEASMSEWMSVITGERRLVTGPVT